jgi:hypothetical protein
MDYRYSPHDPLVSIGVPNDGTRFIHAAKNVDLQKY